MESPGIQGPTMKQKTIQQEPAVARFVAAARNFLDVIDRREADGPDALLDRLLGTIPELYAAAVELPAVETTEVETPPGMSEPDWRTLFESIGGSFTSMTRKWLEHNADALPPRQTEFLADDLADTYRDLSRGLEFWNRSDFQVAVWDWRFHFWHHWGEHAVDALRICHQLRHGTREYEGSR